MQKFCQKLATTLRYRDTPNLEDVGRCAACGPGVEREVRGEEAQDLLAPSRGEFRQRVKVSEADTDISSSQGAKTNLACRFHKSENFER